MDGALLTDRRWTGFPSCGLIQIKSASRIDRAPRFLCSEVWGQRRGQRSAIPSARPRRVEDPVAADGQALIALPDAIVALRSGKGAGSDWIWRVWAFLR